MTFTRLCEKDIYQMCLNLIQRASVKFPVKDTSIKFLE